MLIWLTAALAILTIVCLLTLVILLIVSEKWQQSSEDFFEIQNEFSFAKLLSFKSRVSRNTKTKIAPDAAGTINSESK